MRYLPGKENYTIKNIIRCKATLKSYRWSDDPIKSQCGQSVKDKSNENFCGTHFQHDRNLTPLIRYENQIEALESSLSKLTEENETLKLAKEILNGSLYENYEESKEVIRRISNAITVDRTRIKAEFLKAVPKKKKYAMDILDGDYNSSQEFGEISGWNACRAEILRRIGEL